MKLFDLRAAFFTGLLVVGASTTSNAVQNDCGRPDCSKPRRPHVWSRAQSRRAVAAHAVAAHPSPRPRPGGGNTNSGGNDAAADTRAADEPSPPCEAVEVLVRRGVPGCEVKVDGLLRGLTNDKGELLVEGIAHGTRRIAISKQGYEGDKRDFKFTCNTRETANLNLRIQPVKLRIRTDPPGAEVLVNDPPASAGRTGAEGTLEYVATTPALLLQARRAGYLSDSRRILVSPADAQREVVADAQADSRVTHRRRQRRGSTCACR